jgi:hypothetical protein
MSFAAWDLGLTMWSLSLPQVAATLAAALVAYETKNAAGERLIGEPVLNSVIVLLVVSSVLGPILTERYASGCQCRRSQTHSKDNPKLRNNPRLWWIRQASIALCDECPCTSGRRRGSSPSRRSRRDGIGPICCPSWGWSSRIRPPAWAAVGGNDLGELPRYAGVRHGTGIRRGRATLPSSDEVLDKK